MIVGSNASSTTRMVQIEKIATAAMGSTSIVFSSIPQDYHSLLIYGSLYLNVNIAGNAESYPTTRFNDDAGTNYSRSSLLYTTDNGQTSTTGMDIAVPGPLSPPSPRFAELEIFIPEYSSTSKYKSMYTKSSRIATNTLSGQYHERFVYQWRSTAAITKWSILTGLSGGSPSGTFQSVGSLVMYGIREV